MAVDTGLFIAVTLVYLAIIICLGYLGYRQTKGDDDYMVAGRKANSVVLALSYGATFISTSAIIGFGGVAAQLGMGMIWLTVLNIGLGILVAFIVFGKQTRRIGSKLRAVTFPDLMGKCYQSPFMRYAAGLVIVIAMPLYTAAILIGGAQFITSTLQIPYDTALIAFAAVVALYVVFGGLIAVMYTDALQGGIMLVGMTVLLVLTYVHLGGVVEAHTALAAMSDLVPEALAAGGMTGWTSMPVFGSPIWLTMVTTLVLGVGIGVLAQPQLVVRFMTVKDDRALNRAVLVGGPFILMMTGVAFTVGALTNVYFYQTEGLIALAAAPNGNVDTIIPNFINASMPDLFVVIFMLALLAAAMSTLSALFHVMGTSLGFDLARRTDSGRAAMRPIQIATVVMIVVSVVLAFILPGSIIARATAMFMGLCASAFLPAYAHAMYCSRPSIRAAKISLVVGTVAWFVWTAFVHVKESAALGISNLLFGVPAILSAPWQDVDPLVVALPLSTAALLVGWALDRHEVTAEEAAKAA
ncbi:MULTISPECIES: sodium:solute symporter [Methanoculleus]|uniref:Solute:Na+ symporter, SSS family n=1 Tax=Methanoculleus thermophilus TaxID=2200 RepID=A0A1G9AYZ6_9EURY|nr:MULTISPECIES: sodium:solute symporter family protein [Methanoculleus]NLN09685.1 sodium:solute symporter family protein [Methanoculleus thermophilus]SDK32428.1 solute:Na+ symporter, SSS family [Methanoculleus thermophilus]